MRDDRHPPVEELGWLSRLEPDRARAERTRQRCRAVFAQQRAAQTRTCAPRPVVIALCLLCAAYVRELVVTAVRLLSH